MRTPLLIDFDYLTQNTELPENMDWNKVKWAVEEAQDLEIQDKTGTALLNDVYTQVTTYKDDFAVSADTKWVTLVNNYIKPALKFATLYYCYSSIWIRLTNKGVEKDQTATTSSADSDEIRLKINLYLKLMNGRLTRLYNYLLENHTTYTSFDSGNDGYDDVVPNGDLGWGIITD